MNKLSSYYKPQELKWFDIIGWYQIIGGSIGIVWLLWALTQSTNLLLWLAIALGLGLNSFSIYAGKQLLKNRDFGPTYLIQAIQILSFIGLGLTYQVVIGLALGAGFEWIEDADIVANFKILSLYEFKYSPAQTDKIRVVINFIPVFIINYLMKRKEEAEDRKRLAEYSSANV